MRTKQRDFGAISRASVKRDFKIKETPTPKQKRAQNQNKPKITDELRVASIEEKSAYSKYARYIVGRLVRIIEKANFGSNSWHCEFVYDDDRKALNAAAGWSDRKRQYLFDGVKFK